MPAACLSNSRLRALAPHRDDMNLLLRMNLALGTAFVLAALLLIYVCSRLLAANAQHELVREAGLMMDSAVATFAYTSEEILPLLQGWSEQVIEHGWFQADPLKRAAG